MAKWRKLKMKKYVKDKALKNFMMVKMWKLSLQNFLKIDATFLMFFFLNLHVVVSMGS